MRFASVLRRPGRHRAFYVEDSAPFAADSVDDEPLTDDDEGADTLEEEAG